MREIINQSTIKTIVNRFLEFRKKESREKSMGTIMVVLNVLFRSICLISLTSIPIVSLSNYRIYSHE